MHKQSPQGALPDGTVNAAAAVNRLREQGLLVRALMAVQEEGIFAAVAAAAVMAAFGDYSEHPNGPWKYRVLTNLPEGRPTPRDAAAAETYIQQVSPNVLHVYVRHPADAGSPSSRGTWGAPEIAVVTADRWSKEVHGYQFRKVHFGILSRRRA